MGESVDVSALRAGPATSFRIRALGIRHFIYDAALHAASRFAAHEFLFLYGLHKILSIQLQNERRRNRRSPRHERPDEIARPLHYGEVITR